MSPPDALSSRTAAWLKAELARIDRKQRDLAVEREAMHQRTDALRQQINATDRRHRRLEPLRVAALIVAGMVTGSVLGASVANLLAMAAACR